MTSRKKKIFKIGTGIIILVLLGIAALNIWITSSTRNKVYSRVDDIPECEVALVLGTSKRLVNGNANPFFNNRIATAVELYEKEKVKYFLLSGDSSSRYYNEPTDMKEALLDRGIPESLITLDYAGLRTLESVARCRRIFGHTRVTIVTQRFHSYRALFISDYYGLDARAMVTEAIPISRAFRTIVREYLARAKSVFDLYVCGPDINRDIDSPEGKDK